MNKEQLRYFLDQELERIQMLKLRSDLTDEQKLKAARIGRIQFVSAGAIRNKASQSSRCVSCGMYDGDHWHWCSENKKED